MQKSDQPQFELEWRGGAKVLKLRELARLIRKTTCKRRYNYILSEISIQKFALKRQSST